MSPLWSDLALARAALADAVARGLVDEQDESKRNPPPIRRIPRRRVASFAL